jgi:hypothetical protein
VLIRLAKRSRTGVKDIATRPFFGKPPPSTVDTMQAIEERRLIENADLDDEQKRGADPVAPTFARTSRKLAGGRSPESDLPRSRTLSPGGIAPDSTADEGCALPGVATHRQAAWSTLS